ncbi:HAMP domain-containing sensor histidine kinase [Magnetovibrio sp.]|uniref:sensor histidine kinase n=1 Tax=Magnetovibrio sp. TaxID=2024836 RepID=UPI002F9558E3
MLLRTKVFLAVFLIGVGLSAFIFFVWMPGVEANSRDNLQLHTHSKLVITGEVLVPHLIQNNLANIYDSLDALLQTNSDWVSITLHDKGGNLIYPLSIQAPPDGLELQTISHEVKVRNVVFGVLTLTTDVGGPLSVVHQQNVELFRILLVSLAIALAAILLMLDRFVRKPAKELTIAADYLAKGNYEISLDTRTQDEVGSLARSFQAMRDAICENEKSLHTAIEVAEKASKAKSEFLSSMSHELRTPLNGILGFGQLLDFNPKEPLSAHQKQCVDHIMSSGQHLLDLINEVLDLARIESGHQKIELTSIPLAALVTECVQSVSPLADERAITIKNDVAEECSVVADYTPLKQVLLNLMSNGIKYNNEGGTLTITSEAPRTGWRRIYVTDTGPGIPEEMHNALFEPFNRLGKEGSNISGTGIGLTVTKRLIEAMGGNIGLNSADGEGSTFWVELPERSVAN